MNDLGQFRLGMPVIQFATAALAQPIIQQIMSADHRINVLIGIVVVNFQSFTVRRQFHAVFGSGHLLGMKMQGIDIARAV